MTGRADPAELVALAETVAVAAGPGFDPACYADLPYQEA